MSISRHAPVKRASNVPLIWYARCPTLTAMALAANRGIFQREFLREGVYMVSVRENSSPSVRQGHLDHSLPNLIREADAATAIWAHAGNGRARLLAIGRTWHSVSVVARPGSRMQGLQDIVGRRLSLPREAGTFSPAQVRSLRAWDTILKSRGILAREVEFTTVVADHPSVPFGDIARREVEALLSGQTDVAILFGAKGLEQARSANLREPHRFSSEDIKADERLAGLLELRALTVDEALLDAAPEVVTRIVATLVEVKRWANAFPKEALRHVAIEGQVETHDAAEAYGGLLAEGTGLGLGDSQTAQIEVLHQWLKQRHLVPSLHRLDGWGRPDIFTAAEESLKVMA